MLAPRPAEIAAQLMEAPHTVPLDAVAAEELAVGGAGAIDADLAKRGSNSEALLVIRLLASGRLPDQVGLRCCQNRPLGLSTFGLRTE